MKSIVLSALLCISTGVALGQGSKIIENDLYKPTKSAEAKAYYNNGHDNLEAGDYPKAVANFKLAIAADPNYIDAYDNLGLVFRQMDLLDSAERYYLISHKKYPKGAVALRNLAVVQEYRGDYEKAIEYYKQAKAIDTKDPESYYGLSRMYFLLKKYKEALENGNATEKLYKQRNDPNIGDCYFILCMIHISMGNKPAAIKYRDLAHSVGFKVPQQLEDALK